MKRLMVCGSIILMTGCGMLKKNDTVPEAPTTIERYNEIAVVYHQGLGEKFDALTPQERIFIYYLWRAGLPGYRITADQLHRCAWPLQELFELLLTHESELLDDTQLGTLFDVSLFMHQVRTFLVYLWANHGQYFLLEHEHEKRTPHKIGLDLLTKEYISMALESLGKNVEDVITKDIAKALFNDDYHATLTVPGSIDKSAVNVYGQGFGDHEYAALEHKQKNGVNAHFYVGSDHKPAIEHYAVNGRCRDEMSVMHYWLEKAYKHAQNYPAQFDTHVVESLQWLLTFIATGDEAAFRNYSIAWLKTNSRVDFNLGFIETYHDPKNKVGLFQAEATIKTLDMAQCNKLLFSIERSLPIPAQFHRFQGGNGDGLSMPNASINTKAFAIGDLGPLGITAAYCLPNYEDIRAEHGSKQIIYPAEAGLGLLLNPDIYRKLFHRTSRADWLERNDKACAIVREMWDLQCLLHETLGHGSGKLAEHTFKEGDELCIAGKTYRPGDSIAVTPDNIGLLLGVYEASLEELRAEVIALYVSVVHFDELAALGYFKRWTQKITKTELCDWLIEHMALAGLSRLIHQKDGATIVQGDHARADYVILNYLIDHRCLSIVEEKCEIDGETFGVVDVTVRDQHAAIEAIKALMVQVQTIKSTGDGHAAASLFETYGTKIRHENYIQFLKANRKKVNGDLKVKALLTPIYKAECDESGVIHDARAVWPSDIFDYFMTMRKLELSKL
ncbi:MAG: hypothetical protein WCT20_03650 [Candidatus Babeliales bacterium]